MEALLKLMNKQTLYKKIDELDLNRKYEIIEAERVKTKYADNQVQLVLDDGGTNIKIYLPKKYNNKIPLSSNIKEFVGMFICFEGKENAGSRYASNILSFHKDRDV